MCDSDVSEYSIDELDDDSSDESLDELRDDFSEEDLELEHDSEHILGFVNQDEEVLSQTITSDLDADLHSYKHEPGHIKMDENEYLNGSTAGFGKKLREINREINNEDFSDEQIVQSLKKR